MNITLAELFSIDPFTWTELGTAILCGFIVGLERQLRGKPVGIRTSSLIVLGTYLFIAASNSLNNDVTDTGGNVNWRVLVNMHLFGHGVGTVGAG